MIAHPRRKPKKTDRFHHKHFPTFSKAGHSVFWWFLHLYMPFMVHYMTDKYEDKRHHVIVDTIYAAVTMLLVAINIGIGIWAYLYFTPASVDMSMVLSGNVVSGQPMDIIVNYANPYRDIEDVRFDVALPEGFFLTAEDSAAHFEVGNLEKNAVGRFEVTGIVIGNVGQRYTAETVVTYTHLNREWTELAFIHFTIKDSSLITTVELPDTVSYSQPIEGKVHVLNESSIVRTDVDVTIEAPPHFTITSVAQGNINVDVQPDGKSFRIGRLEAGAQLDVSFSGYFSVPDAVANELLGDQQTEIVAYPVSNVEDPVLHQPTEERFAGRSGVETINVVNPRIVATMTAPSAINFGDRVRADVTITNNGDVAIRDVQLGLDLNGSTLSANGVTVQANGETVALGGSEDATLPIPARLEPGQSASFTLVVPTTSSNDREVSGRIRLSGSAFVEQLESRVPFTTVESTVKFNTKMVFDASLLYYTTDNEPIGYGPYPPKPWQITSFRTLLGFHNVNNPLRNVRIVATLSDQAKWTNVYSVSAGTTMQWNEGARQVIWTIDSLEPQSANYGSQFEVLFTPNPFQVGLSPSVITGITIQGEDAFTGNTVTVSHGSLATPVAVSQ